MEHDGGHRSGELKAVLDSGRLRKRRKMGPPASARLIDEQLPNFLLGLSCPSELFPNSKASLPSRYQVFIYSLSAESVGPVPKPLNQFVAIRIQGSHFLVEVNGITSFQPRLDDCVADSLSGL